MKRNLLTLGKTSDAAPFVVRSSARQKAGEFPQNRAVRTAVLLTLVETHDGVGDLAHQVAAVVRRLQVQFQGQLTEQIQSRPGAPVQIEDFIQVGIESGGEAAGGGTLAGADFDGEQTGAVMLDQELEPRLDLGPGLRSEQLLGIGVVAERRFLETEESFHHGDYSFPSKQL